MSGHPLEIRAAADALRDGTVTSVELTRQALALADLHDDWVGSFISRFDASALARAEQADAELAAGVDLGPLHGIPLGVKDILAASEGPTTAQSVVLDPAWGDGRDSPVLRRLRRAGSIIVGKTTTMEFAMGLPEADKPFPVPVNPWMRDRWPGGSSSGTANGLVCGFFLGGIGSDTGGSIRIPAAFCGVTGLMPTFGVVPTTGCVPLAFSLDRVGPLARSAWDCGVILQAIAGYDASDPSSSARPVPDYLLGIGDGIRGLRVGVARGPLDSATPEVTAVFDSAVAVLQDLGAQVVEVTIPLYREMLAAVMVTISAEACAHHQGDLAARWEDYTATARTMIAAGALVSGSEYVQAQRVRRVGQRRLADMFAELDVIVTPTITTTAPPLDAAMGAGIAPHLQTTYWNGVGNPVLAVPIGFTDGMPLGMQVCGAPFAEPTLLRVGHAYQQSTEWHRQVPNLEAVRG